MLGLLYPVIRFKVRLHVNIKNHTKRLKYKVCSGKNSFDKWQDNCMINRNQLPDQSRKDNVCSCFYSNTLF